ncbi:MAG: YjbQ family protein, partial [Candidatus Bathyarchaeia archaeon]
MKSLTEYLWFNTRERRAYINITDKVEEIVRKSRIKEGLCLVNAMHITASVYINDAEAGLIRDFDDLLE